MFPFIRVVVVLVSLHSNTTWTKASSLASFSLFWDVKKTLKVIEVKFCDEEATQNKTDYQSPQTSALATNSTAPGQFHRCRVKNKIKTGKAGLEQ